jgi:hypothetical protein
MSEANDVLRRMKTGKAVGHDEISIKVWKFLGVCWLTNLFNKIFSVNKIPCEWMRSTLILIYKNKGDIQNCIN